MTAPALDPGDAHPYRSLAPDAFGRLVGVEADVVDDWLRRGLPMTAGYCDGFTACNWVTWHALAEAPALARRWATYRQHFTGEPIDRTVRWRWQRRHEAWFGQGVSAWRWWLPEPLDRPWQQTDGQRTLERQGGAGTGATVRATTTVVVSAQQSHSFEHALVRTLVEQMQAFAADFTYGYRHHGHDESGQDGHGSCLDICLAFGRSLDRPWRLCAGLVLHPSVANPHYWLEVQDDDGAWCPCDPSLVCIARMLDQPLADWAHWHVGWQDGRRLLLACGPWGARPDLPDDWPVAGFGSAVPGELIAEVDGHWCDAWACQDQVCGATRSSFVVLPAD